MTQGRWATSGDGHPHWQQQAQWRQEAWPDRSQDRNQDRSQSWPDRSWPEEPSALWPPTAPIVPVPVTQRPVPSGRLALPIVGALLVAVSTVALWITASDVRPGGLLGAWYALAGGAYAAALVGTVYAFAANLDSAILRWIHLGVGLCAGAAVVYAGTSLAGAAVATMWTLLTAGAMLTMGVGFLVGLAVLPRLGNRLAARIVGATVLLGYALLHVTAVNSLFFSPPIPVYLAGIGYVTYAIGAAIGPRYR